MRTSEPEFCWAIPEERHYLHKQKTPCVWTGGGWKMNHRSGAFHCKFHMLRWDTNAFIDLLRANRLIATVTKNPRAVTLSRLLVRNGEEGTPPLMGQSWAFERSVNKGRQDPTDRSNPPEYRSPWAPSTSRRRMLSTSATEQREIQHTVLLIYRSPLQCICWSFRTATHEHAIATKSHVLVAFLGLGYKNPQISVQVGFPAEAAWTGEPRYYI